jgi:co-chaperonin GroES (HSP10)
MEVAFEKPQRELAADVPKPLLWRVLVQPYEPPRSTQGGILLAGETIENTRLLTVVGRVVAMGSLAFKAKTRSGLDLTEEANRPDVGDWVLYGTYAGQRIRMKDGRHFVVLNDDEIVSRIDQPESYVFLP